MKIGTHLTILGNILPLIAGTSLYFLLTSQYMYALITGIIGSIYGNLHTRYIAKHIKNNITNLIADLFTFNYELNTSSIEEIVRRVKHE